MIQPGVCGHEWCYICLAPFQRNQHDFLYCRHEPDCSETDPFVDLVDPGGHRGPPGFMRDFDAAFRAPGFVQPRPLAQGHRDERGGAGEVLALLREAREELLQAREELLLRDGERMMPEHPRQGNVEPHHPVQLLRMQTMLDEELNRARIARHGNQPPPEDHAAAVWARVWLSLENDGVGMAATVADAAAARNRRMPLPPLRMPGRHGDG